MSLDANVNYTAVIGAQAPAAADECAEVIAGYVLQDRLGAGGYGEVWSAIGPGGLTKAVKILHGQHDGPQADTELKALERIRQVRHPFLLNLERIEVVDGRVIVVTELADRSLEDCYQEAIRAGQKGIPVEELLGYLLEASSALDFMLEEHGLQHLDIKPDNVMLQGKHAKIGDFGLTRSVQQTNASMVGSFTPLYVAPEILEGTPSRSSDQYSLAIVYQIMLTGISPFDGRTAAQLMAQQLRSKPDLSALPPIDRTPIARALSKHPRTRHESCQALIEDLIHRRKSRGRAKSHPVKMPADSSRIPRRAEASVKPSSPSPAAIAKDVNRDLEVKPLRPVEIDPTDVSCRPTIFLGVGGLGGRVLRRLRGVFAENSGAENSLPAFAFLYVDTDNDAIVAACNANGHTGLHESESLLIPLRKPSGYRSNSGQRLEWLSRRWRCNIPRSRKVEGIRPLGRLALVDHQDQLRDRLESVLAEATTDEALQTTQAATAFPFEQGIADVFIVASTCGGTGSGAVLDFAYLVRDAFAELKLRCGSLSGLLLHATGSSSQQAELQKASTIACLRELRHFTTPGLSYPDNFVRHKGAAEALPFDQAYVVHLGDELNEDAFEQATKEISKYLHARTLTPARAHFQQWQQCEQSDSNYSAGEFALRTLGITALDLPRRQQLQCEAAHLCRAVIQRCGESPQHHEDASVAERFPANAALLSTLKLTKEDVTAQVMAVINGTAGKNFDEYFDENWEQLQRAQREQAPEIQALLQSIDAEIAPAPDGNPQTDAKSPRAFLSTLQNLLKMSSQEAQRSIQAHLFSHLDLSPGCLAAAAESTNDLAVRLDTLLAQCAELHARIVGERKQLWNSAASGRAEPEASQPDPIPEAAQIRTLCYRYSIIRYCELTWERVIQYVTVIRGLTKEIGTELVNLRFSCRKLDEQYEQHIREHSVVATNDSASAEPCQPAALRDLAESTVEAFAETIRQNGDLHLPQLLAGDQECTRIANWMKDHAVGFLKEGAFFHEARSERAKADAEPSCPLPIVTKPHLSQVGGGGRILAVVPDDIPMQQWLSRVRQEFGDCVSTSSSAGEALFICCEVQGIALDAVIARLSEHDSQLEEAAWHLHTRTDVEW
jgi:serine/threonine protein kinase